MSEASIKSVRHVTEAITIVNGVGITDRTFDVEAIELVTRREFWQLRDQGFDIEELHGWERRRAIVELRRLARINMSGPRQIVILRRQRWASTMSTVSVRYGGSRFACTICGDIGCEDHP